MYDIIHNVNILEIKNLTYSYQEGETVLNNVSFAVEKGSYTAILGHNGSGKSTLAKVIMGLCPNYEGQIIINGNELNKKNLPLIRHDIAMVFQNPDNQFIGATVEDDIAFGLENNRVERGQMAAIVHDYAKKVGMDAYLAKEPIYLSGGQKQRVAIAGVLALAPKIIIFDESTSMLDPKGKREIFNLISEIKKNNPDLTIISITHDIEEAYLSDFIVVMNHGEIIKQGTPKEALKDEEALKQENLDLPFKVKLRHKLAAVGFDIPEDASLEEIGDIVCQSK